MVQMKCFCQLKMELEMMTLTVFWMQGQRRTNALTDSIAKVLPSDEQLLNFKLDHASVHMFEGVDYTQKKKREEELIGLVYKETSLQQSLRKRKVELNEWI